MVICYSSHEKITHLLCCFSVAQWCLTLCHPMNCSPPGSSVCGILQARILEGLPFPSPGDLPNPGIKPLSPALAGEFFTNWGQYDCWSACYFVLSGTGSWLWSCLIQSWVPGREIWVTGPKEAQVRHWGSNGMVRTLLSQVGKTTALSSWQPDIWLHVPNITFTYYYFLIFIRLAVLGLSCRVFAAAHRLSSCMMHALSKLRHGDPAALRRVGFQFLQQRSNSRLHAARYLPTTEPPGKSPVLP